MKKKLIYLVIATVMIFGMIGLSGCDGSNPNEGYIYGLEDARFIAHFDKSFTVFEVELIQINPMLINNRHELIEWQKEELKKWEAWGSTNHLDNFDYENFLIEYNDAFFASYQLIFIPFMGSILDYEVEKISYQDNVLTVKFIATTRPRTIPDVAHPHLTIIEITRISDNLDIIFSHRLRDSGRFTRQ